jgi:hypothetical protein
MLIGQPRESTNRNAVHQRPANGNWRARDVTGEMSETGSTLSVRVRKSVNGWNGRKTKGMLGGHEIAAKSHACSHQLAPGNDERGKRRGDYFDALGWHSHPAFMISSTLAAGLFQYILREGHCLESHAYPQ